jgi:hypothetical protein
MARALGTDHGERLIEAGTGQVGAGQPVVGVDPLESDAEPFECDLMGGEVLLVGRAAA